MRISSSGANRELRFLRARLGRVIRDVRRKIQGDAALEERFGPLLALAVGSGSRPSASAGPRSTPCMRRRWSASARVRPIHRMSSAAR